jgi:hypothetical protein
MPTPSVPPMNYRSSLRVSVTLWSLVVSSVGCSNGSPSPSTPYAPSANDVAILFPHPQMGEDDLLISMSEELLPAALFARLGDSNGDLPRLAEGAGSTDVYPRLRVTSARIDPCFDNVSPCQRQVRLVAQILFPLTSDPEPPSLSDAAIHLFYALDDELFVDLLAALRETGSEAGPLGVHPGLVREGLDSAYAQSIRTALVTACEAGTLTRFTFMATGRSKNWFFGGFDRAGDGTFVLSNIPGVAATSDSFTDQGSEGFRFGTPFSVAWFPDSLLATDSTQALSPGEFTEGVDLLARLANPNLVSTSEVSCAACHVADTTRVQSSLDRGSSTPATSTFDFAASLPAPDVPPTGFGNLHAFSWAFGEASVSARTAHEVELVVHELSSDGFRASLPPHLRARLE